MNETPAPPSPSAALGLTFRSSLADLAALRAAGLVVHVLCLAGGFSFAVQGVRCVVRPHDYVILPDGSLCTDLVVGEGCRVELLAFPDRLASAAVFRNGYGVVGHLSLLANPVMPLTAADFRTCLSDLRRLRRRAEEHAHLFRDELLATLLKAHILDLYDIHARRYGGVRPDSRQAEIMQGFVGLLVGGAVCADRGLDHYAARLCITPHYLSEVSRRTTGRPATFWIHRFFLREVVRLVSDRSLPLAEAALRLRFSSVSYLTRYVRRHLGLTPSALRRAP